MGSDAPGNCGAKPMTMPHVTIYTDGGCEPNPGRGGWGALIITDGITRELSGYEASTTNNRMELTAAIEALKNLTEPSVVELFTDSQYLKRGITEWMTKWLSKNWRGSNGPVLNQDLWQALLNAEKPHRVTWHWVKGHADNIYNQRADLLSQQARKRV
jgi:ribonuclease HI